MSSKLFNVAIAPLALTMIVSGVSLGLDTLGWAQVDQSSQRVQRLRRQLASR